MSIGFGYDVHKLVEGRPLILGGVEIPFDKGLLGHSDADVLSHAIGDAILGALGEGDLGCHFPDSDSNYKNISSMKILIYITNILEKKGFSLINIDSTIVAQEPRLSPYISRMKSRLTYTLGIPENIINIKATTNEGLGWIGEGRGIAAYAVVLLKEKQ
ncbi:MAG: 2-C-methyl-D-erythritol 2,4-cyclodiphosphate synthase [Thermodesulfobacteriota bacterium]|nr:2-C-methyl-D-erythritol 2,4-cyclodiphosphate synthase [Thermodesulfobacteriota bacterium]